MTLIELVKLDQDMLTRAQREMLYLAEHFMTKYHDGQVRATGEPYHEHLIKSYFVIRQLGLPFPTQPATLMHDSVEDCKEITYAFLLRHFRPRRIADLVNAVTKYDENSYFPQMEQAVYKRHLWETIFIKNSDRLDNVNTVDGFTDIARRIRFLEETLGPLADLNSVCRPSIPQRFLFAFDELTESVLTLAQDKLSSNLADLIAQRATQGA